MKVKKVVALIVVQVNFVKVKVLVVVAKNVMLVFIETIESTVEQLVGPSDPKQPEKGSLTLQVGEINNPIGRRLLDEKRNTVRFPLAPASPAFEDKILIDPLPAAVLPPLRTEISPPLF